MLGYIRANLQALLIGVDFPSSKRQCIKSEVKVEIVLVFSDDST